MPNHRKHLFVFLTFLGAVLQGNAQTIVRKNIVVADRDTRQPISFASVRFLGTRQGKTADLNGRVSLSANDKARFQFGCVGYDTLAIIFEAIQDSVFLTPRTNVLEAVIVAPTDESNPRALEIVQKAISNKKLNDPDALEYYSFTTYGKVYIDTLSGEAKNLFLISKADSLAQEAKPNYLFMIESVIDHQYRQPNLRSTNMVAQKVSGIKNAYLLGLATQLQYYNFYQNEFLLLGMKYYNPISSSYRGLYVFRGIDSLQGEDGYYTYILPFRPKRNKYGVELMRGEVHIHEKDFAIVNVTARASTEDANQVAFKQRYRLVNGKWFPEQLYTEVAFNITSGGKEKAKSDDRIKAYNVTYLKNINITNPVNKSAFGNYTLTAANDVDKKPDSFWNKQRVIPLTTAERSTYRFVDSVLGEVKTQRIINGLINFSKYIVQGYVPIKKVNLDLKRVISFNEYEGLRLGVGFTTNEQLMKKTRLGAYWGYGLRDRAMKYGGRIEQVINSGKDVIAGISFNQDIALAGLSGYKDLPVPPAGLLRLLTNRADSVQKTELYADFWMFKKFRTRWYANYQDRQFTQGYQFAMIEKQNTFLERVGVYETGLHITSGFKQGGLKLDNFFSFDRSVSKNFLDIDLRNGWLFQNGTRHPYQKAEVKYVRQLSLGRAGSLNTITTGGIINGHLPFGMLFGNMGSGSRAASSILVPATFQTMRDFEFTNDRYAALFTTYESGYLFQKAKKFGIAALLANNIGWGSFDNSSLHNSMVAPSMNLWYTETGAGLRFRMKGFNMGVLAMYRYGAYHMADAQSNWAFKIVTGGFN